MTIESREHLLTAQRFKVERLREKDKDGKVREREVVRHTGAVTVLPIVDDDRICLIRNWRVAVEETLIEIPAGTLEPGEDPAECARRELVEETGYRAGRIEFVQEFFLSPGILDEKMHFFLAKDLTPGETALEPGERIENWIVTWKEALELVKSGKIRDSKTLTGILLGHALLKNER
jgi:ADP-ribose pyrophosphatase